jgi:hypothetical protein
MTHDVMGVSRFCSRVQDSRLGFQGAPVLCLCMDLTPACVLSSINASPVAACLTLRCVFALSLLSPQRCPCCCPCNALALLLD